MKKTEQKIKKSRLILAIIMLIIYVIIVFLNNKSIIPNMPFNNMVWKIYKLIIFVLIILSFKKMYTNKLMFIISIIIITGVVDNIRLESNFLKFDSLQSVIKYNRNVVSNENYYYTDEYVFFKHDKYSGGMYLKHNEETYSDIFFLTQTYSKWEENFEIIIYNISNEKNLYVIKKDECNNENLYDSKGNEYASFLSVKGNEKSCLYGYLTSKDYQASIIIDGKEYNLTSEINIH